MGAVQRFPRKMGKSRAELKEAFDRIDKDNSGNVDIGELQELLLAVDIEPNDVTLWHMMEKLDTTIPYGQVDFDEFYEYMQVHHSGEGLGRTPTMPANREEWNARLDEIDSVERGAVAVRHDVQGAVSMSEEQVIQRYPLGKKLGAGKYASVHKCTDTQTGEDRAMKIFYKKNRSKKKFYDVIQEANKMRRVHKHPNIVKVYDLIETKERLIMLIEFVEGGQLYDEILKRKPKEKGSGHFTERMAGKIIGEITSAIKFMHEQEVVHCDLKPENVLCTHNPSTDKFDIKVADMGLSKILEPGIKQNLTYCGTPLYMAPEMLRKEQYGCPVDTWSIGCMMHELMCGEPPFTGKNMMELERNVTNFGGLGDESASTRRIKKQFAKYGVSKRAQELIGMYLHPNPAERITAADAMQHDWIAKNEELCGDHMGEVQLNLQLSTERRKFRRAVNKIVLSRRILNTIKHAGQKSGAAAPHASSPKKSHSHVHSKPEEEAGCNCSMM